MSEWRFFGGSQIFIWRKMMVAHFNVWNGAFWGLLLEAKCAVQGTGKLASVLLVNEALRCGNANLWSYIYIYIVDHRGIWGMDWGMNGPSQLFQNSFPSYDPSILIIQWYSMSQSQSMNASKCCSHCPHQNPHNLTSGIVKNKANVNGKFPWLRWSANCYGGYAAKPGKNQRGVRK